VAIPVDVVEATPSQLQAFVALECVAQNTRYTSTGTATCFVRVHEKEGQYLLGPHHVLALTEVQGIFETAGDVPSISYEGTPLGKLAFLPADPDSVDAALASSDGRAQIEVPADGEPIYLSKILPSGGVIPPLFWILTRHGSIRARFIGQRDHTEPYYGDSTLLTCRDAIYSMVLDGQPSLVPGDSGAALATDNGTLIAMHYAGSPPPGGPESYAIPAIRLFGAFTGLVLRLD
jgi:hypothetical protein